MNKIQLLTYLTDAAVRHKKDWRKSIIRNSHMNEVEEVLLDVVDEKVFDGIIVDFINKIGVEQGCDYGLHTKDLLTHKPKWE